MSDNVLIIRQSAADVKIIMRLVATDPNIFVVNFLSSYLLWPGQREVQGVYNWCGVWILIARRALSSPLLNILNHLFAQYNVTPDPPPPASRTAPYHCYTFS